MNMRKKHRQNRNLTTRYIYINYRIKTEILQKIVTFGELLLEPSDTIRPESTRQFNIKILSTVIDSVHVSSVK